MRPAFGFHRLLAGHSPPVETIIMKAREMAHTATEQDFRHWREKIIQQCKIEGDLSDSIRGRCLDYALEGAEYDADCFGEYRKNVIRVLEQMDCAAGASPAPVYYYQMARELADHWLEVDDALEDCREQTGENWPLGKGSVLNALWFAYEWNAHDLAGIIENAALNEEQREELS